MSIIDRRALLLSVHPRFADSLMEGSKSVELRRQRIDVQPGTLVLLYATSPIMAIVAIGTVQQVDTDEHDMLWNRYEHNLGLSRDEFDAYLAGTRRASALRLAEVKKLPDPLSLAFLRKDDRFHPPQSYRFIANGDPLSIRRLVGLLQTKEETAASQCLVC